MISVRTAKNFDAGESNYLIETCAISFHIDQNSINIYELPNSN